LRSGLDYGTRQEDGEHAHAPTYASWKDAAAVELMQRHGVPIYLHTQPASLMPILPSRDVEDTMRFVSMRGTVSIIRKRATKTWCCRSRDRPGYPGFGNEQARAEFKLRFQKPS